MHSPSTQPARVRQGDTAALAAAFHEHRPHLRRIIADRLNGRLHRRIDPEDVLQESFLRAAQRCACLHGDTPHSLFVWLRLIVIQTLADVRRQHLGTQKREASRECAIHGSRETTSRTSPGATGLIARVASPPEAAERVELAELLQTALARLDSIDQEVLGLRHFQELTNHEVALTLGIQPKAASIRYVRALRRLKAVMDEFGPLDSPFGPS